jgi:hypothetical protein
MINIIDAICDDNIFKPFVKGTSWVRWLVFLKALFAIPMDDAELAIYREHTGRQAPPTTPSHEAWLVIGRRGGKSFVLALIAVFLAAFRDWRPFLGPGEQATIMIIAADRRQARVILRYVVGLLNGTPMLAKTIVAQTKETIELSNRVTIEIHTSSFRTVRGYSIVAALCDELAFWQSDETSAEPDTEVINALRPGMASIPDAMLLCASSPYARRGALWESYRKHFGQEGDEVLVWRADTRSMNPSVPQSYIDRQMADDAAKASAEYLAQFRSDIEAFVSREVIENCTMRGLYEMPPAPLVSYSAFLDPSGGSADSFACAVGHIDGDMIKIDCLREVKPPFSPESVVSELSQLLKSYRVFKVTGDRYAGLWPSQQFAKHGITYEPSTLTKSELYVAALPRLNSGLVELLDSPRLRAQFCGLERRVHRGGRDSIDHASGAHDDLANVCAGLIATCTTSKGWSLAIWRAAVGDGDPPLDGNAAVRERARRMHPHMSETDIARIGQPLQPTPEMIRKAFAEAEALPTSGPNAPGAIPMGDGAYCAPTAIESAQAIQRFVNERAQRLAYEQALVARTGRPLQPTPEMIRKAYAEAEALPTSGPNAPGAFSRGEGGYYAPTAIERAQAIQRFVKERAQYLAMEQAERDLAALRDEKKV